MTIDRGDMQVELGRRGRCVLHVEDEEAFRVLSVVGRVGGPSEPAETGRGREGEEEGASGGEGGTVAVDEGDEL